MKKWQVIVTTFVVTALIGVNSYLTFGEDSTVATTVFSPTYTVAEEEDVRNMIEKPSFIIPREVVTIYVNDEESIEQWLIEEGDTVQASDELVLLETERIDGQVDAWYAEQSALEAQRERVEETIAMLEDERYSADSDSERSESVVPLEELNVELNVKMDQRGSFAQAIAEAERELANIDRQLNMLAFQIDQSYVRPAIISPIDGVVGKIDAHGVRPTIDIYSEATQLVTYVNGEEWEQLLVGNDVYIEYDEFEERAEGLVDRLSIIPTESNRWYEAFIEQTTLEREHALDQYEVRIDPVDLHTREPYGKLFDISIVGNEATDAIIVPTQYVERQKTDEGTVYVLNEDGVAEQIDVAIAFAHDGTYVTTDGIVYEDVVLERGLDATRVALPMKWNFPSKSAWKTFGWKNYMKYAIQR